MKALSIFALTASLAFLAAPQAKAGDDADALIGGLIGGVIIGSILADDDVRASVSVGYGDHGYYDWVSVRSWVPGHYVYRHDHCGNTVRVWVSGHYTHVREKVWVSGYRHHSHRHHGHHYRHHDRRDRHDRYDRRDYRDGRRDRYDRRGDYRHRSEHREQRVSRRF